MAYIGAQPRLGNFQACDAITTSATTTFNLLVGGTAIFPQSAQHCLVSLNGVLQAPISSYTISGSTIIFAAALTTDDSIDFITILGDTLDLGVPSDDTVGAAQIKADLISGTTALAATPADTDELLLSDAGTLKRIDYSHIKSIKQIVNGNFGTEQNISNTSYADSAITLNITPASTSHKVLVIVAPNTDGYVNTSDHRQFYLQVLRASTVLMIKQIQIGAVKNPTNDYVYGSIDGTMVYLDSPSSTSELTYKVQAKVSNTANNCNVRFNGTSSAGHSTMTLIEVD